MGVPPGTPAGIDYVAMNEQVRKSSRPNFQGCQLPVCSKFNIEFLEREAQDYCDKAVVELLRFGFPINSSITFGAVNKVRNHTGATEFPKAIDEYLTKEAAHNAIIGPFANNPFSVPCKINPLNSVPKRDSCERRIIVDLSFPRGRSVNNTIPKDTYLGEPCQLKFPTVDALIDLVKLKGQGCALFKRDLRRAYRQIPVDPGDIHNLGYTWRDQLFFDVVLPMGLRSISDDMSEGAEHAPEAAFDPIVTQKPNHTLSLAPQEQASANPRPPTAGAPLWPPLHVFTQPLIASPDRANHAAAQDKEDQDAATLRDYVKSKQNKSSQEN